MKKKYGFILLVLAFCVQGLKAQEEEAKLTVPSSPAFSILNFEPSAVMRPTTNKDLAADILNSFDKDGKLVMNAGLEVTPYWLKSRPTLTSNQYLNPNVGQAFRQSFTLSGATVKDSSSGDNKFGLGFRFKLFNGKPVDDLKQANEELTAEATIMANIAVARGMIGTSINTRQGAIDFVINTMVAQHYTVTTINKFRQDAENLAKKFTDSATDIKLFLETLIESRLEANKESIKKVADLTYERKGFILEFAGASAFNTTDDNSLERMGFWINASNYVSPDDIFTFTGRYMFQNQDSSISNLDAGLGYLKKAKKYNISLEAMLRWYRAEIPDFNSNNQPITRVEKNFTYRFALQASYIINKEISLNLSLGKDFASPFISRSGIFSILGINYSIFNKEKVVL